MSAVAHLYSGPVFITGTLTVQESLIADSVAPKSGAGAPKIQWLPNITAGQYTGGTVATTGYSSQLADGVYLVEGKCIWSGGVWASAPAVAVSFTGPYNPTTTSYMPLAAVLGISATVAGPYSAKITTGIGSPVYLYDKSGAQITTDKLAAQGYIEFRGVIVDNDASGMFGVPVSEPNMVARARTAGEVFATAAEDDVCICNNATGKTLKLGVGPTTHTLQIANGAVTIAGSLATNSISTTTGIAAPKSTWLPTITAGQTSGGSTAYTGYVSQIAAGLYFVEGKAVWSGVTWASAPAQAVSFQGPFTPSLSGTYVPLAHYSGVSTSVNGPLHAKLTTDAGNAIYLLDRDGNVLLTTSMTGAGGYVEFRGLVVDGDNASGMFSMPLGTPNLLTYVRNAGEALGTSSAGDVCISNPNSTKTLKLGVGSTQHSLQIADGAVTAVGTLTTTGNLNAGGTGASGAFHVVPSAHYYTPLVQNAQWDVGLNAWKSDDGGQSSMIEMGGGSSVPASYIRLKTAGAPDGQGKVTFVNALNIDNAGRIGINKEADPNYQVDVAGGLRTVNSATGAYALLTGNGTIYTTSAIAVHNKDVPVMEKERLVILANQSAGFSDVVAGDPLIFSNKADILIGRGPNQNGLVPLRVSDEQVKVQQTFVATEAAVMKWATLARSPGSTGNNGTYLQITSNDQVGGVPWTNAGANDVILWCTPDPLCIGQATTVGKAPLRVSKDAVEIGQPLTSTGNVMLDGATTVTGGLTLNGNTTISASGVVNVDAGLLAKNHFGYCGYQGDGGGFLLETGMVGIKPDATTANKLYLVWGSPVDNQFYTTTLTGVLGS